MGEVNGDAVFLVEVFGEVLGTIDGAMLTTCAAEGEHQVGEPTLEITLHVRVGQPIDALQEYKNLAIVLQELDDGSIQTGNLFVRLIAPRIVRAATVKDITASITGLIHRYTPFKGE